MNRGLSSCGRNVVTPVSHRASSAVRYPRQILASLVLGSSLLAYSCLAQRTPGSNGPAANDTNVQTTGPTGAAQIVDVAKVLASAKDSARNISSLLLSQTQKAGAVETFVKIVGIKSPSQEEWAVREELRQMLVSLQANEFDCTRAGTNPPLNLVMEFPATKDFENRPAVILNAHIDTISGRRGYAPEQMDFDPQAREFFHRQQGSFGSDDKAGVTVVLTALRTVKMDYWDKGVGHRKLLLILTAQEEIGCLGARYLGANHPELFNNVEIALTSDGPINYDTPSFYPENSFVVVVDEKTSRTSPYSRVIEYMQDLCALKKVTFAKTRNGLGQGDFAHFPPQAHSDLHFRSPYQNHHRRERVKLDDLFNHIDLFTYLVLRLDDTPIRFNQR